jgi:hypothetical protein
MFRVNVFSSGKVFCYYVESSRALALQRLIKCKKRYPYLQFNMRIVDN